jgi:glycopeptide antibiotics resistance protein
MKINKKFLFVIYLLIVTIMSLLPSRDIPEVTLFPNFDKLVHFSMYALFSFLMLWAWPEKFTGKKQILPFLMVVAYGFLMEALQRYSNLGRTFDLFDELANCLGFFPGWLFWRLIRDKGNTEKISWYIPFFKKQVKE